MDDEDVSRELDRVTAVVPSDEVKVRLLASIGGGRFAEFAASIAAMFDVSVDRAHELLGLIERSASWQTKLPGVAIVALPGGPALADAECVFLKLAPGATFPMHAHVGEESAVVLAGQVRDVTHDRKLGPGDGWQLAAGSRHMLVGQPSTTGDGSDPCICAVCARGGIVFAPRSEASQ